MSAHIKEPTVTIIIPAYNEAASLRACLDSCLLQTTMPDEILVIDNNSTDDTYAIAEEYRQKHPKLIKLLKQPKQGLIPTRDFGFDQAKSEVLGRIDADSRLEPEWVAALKDIFKDNTIMAATGPSYFYDSPPSFKKIASDIHRFITHHINERIAGHKMLWGSNMALRKSAWQTIKPHTCSVKDIIEDLDLAIHCAEAGLKMHFDERLMNSISPRRYLSSPKGIYSYLQMWPRTYEIHDRKKSARMARAAVPVVLAGTYVPTNLGLRGYDPVANRFSIKKFIGHVPNKRGNP
ncbi:MAG TPA: glycosyltransferase family 2 protein [Candidatus Saccharimonadales bacterium]